MKAVAFAALAALACGGSATGTQSEPSVTGEWRATDASGRVMVLDLTQTGDTVNGTGSVVGVVSVTAAGHNPLNLPLCCQPDGICLPCANQFPVALTIIDPASDTLAGSAQFISSDSLSAVLLKTGPSPGFPFSSGVLTFSRAVLAH